MSLLGIDIGTTGCKVAAFSEKGRLIAVAYREYRKLAFPPGRAELQSSEVLNDLWAIIPQVTSQTHADPVQALAVSSLGEAMTPVTQDRKILSNSILSTDIRGQNYIEALSREISQEDFYKINPNILAPSYSLPKLLWAKDHTPDIYNRAYKFLLWSDLVIFMLGGSPITGYSLANRTLLFDIHQKNWSDKLLNLTGIDRDKLPDVAPAGTLAGTIDPGVAQQLCLPGNVKLIVGGHDQCCNALGAGAFEQGKTVCGMGTFECITPVYNNIPKQLPFLLQNGLNIEHHLLPDRYVSFLYNQSGSLVKWFRDTFAAADKQLMPPGKDIYDLLTAEMPNEPTSLFVLPHFEMTGPPKYIADSAGVILGLKTTTTRGEILKAILEAATLYFVESLENLKTIGIETTEFIATGGGAKSDRWLQLKADILNAPFKRLKQTEAGLVGAAIIAGLAIKTWNSPRQAAALFIKADALFEPDPSAHKRYREKYMRFKELYPSLAPLIEKPF